MTPASAGVHGPGESTTAAGYYPGAAGITVKVLTERATGRLLGAQLIGGDGAAKRVDVHDVRDGYLPWQGERVKDEFEALKRSLQPDLILTQFRDDRHQDHRVISDLAYNTWRDHTVLEYEILKYDGDLGRPNLYAPLPEDLCKRKVDLLMQGFPTQAGRQWFTEDTFWAMLRIRGVESNSPTKFAEAFHARKLLI